MLNDALLLSSACALLLSWCMCSFATHAPAYTCTPTHAPLPCSGSGVYISLPVHRPILFVEGQWIDLILAENLDERKTIEVRSQRIVKYVGKRIRLAEIGKKQIRGSVCLTSCSQKPLTQEQWVESRHQHRIAGNRPYARTFAWHLAEPQPCTPYSFQPKPGAQIWQIKG
jgi:hypothetical protein